MPCGYARQHDNEFWHQRHDVISVVNATFDTLSNENDRRLVQDAHRSHLVQLKLLHPRFQKPKKGQLPEFDEKTGMMLAKGCILTALDCLLLRPTIIIFGLLKRQISLFMRIGFLFVVSTRTSTLLPETGINFEIQSRQLSRA
jgi:hypothetical protein